MQQTGATFRSGIRILNCSSEGAAMNSHRYDLYRAETLQRSRVNNIEPEDSFGINLQRVEIRTVAAKNGTSFQPLTVEPR